MQGSDARIHLPREGAGRPGALAVGWSCRRRRPLLTEHSAVSAIRCSLAPALQQVSYLRGIFPEDNFKAVDMRNLDSALRRRCQWRPSAAARKRLSACLPASAEIFRCPNHPAAFPCPKPITYQPDMEIRMLLASNPESQRLVNWVEGGGCWALTAVLVLPCCPACGSRVPILSAGLPAPRYPHQVGERQLAHTSSHQLPPTRSPTRRSLPTTSPHPPGPAPAN